MVSAFQSGDESPEPKGMVNLRDTDDFVNSLPQTVASLPPAWRDIFDSSHDVIVTRAPGRIDLMGGIADYSGALVLQWPIESAAHVALQRRRDKSLRLVSLPANKSCALRVLEIELNDLLTAHSANYSTAREFFAGDPANHWAAYVAGAFVVLSRERQAHFNEGAGLLIKSAVPEGKGVSSSAALEVAAMQAVNAAYGLNIAPADLARLSQKVENLIAGAPCGIMDQMTAACGEANRLIELLCQPAELKGTTALPPQLEVWGIDSGIRHSVAGSGYRTVRTAAFMGYRIIAELAGLRVRAQADSARVQIDDGRWHGYLANIGPQGFERDFVAHLSPRIRGSVFLDRYHGITDQVTSVDPLIDYPVLAATRHPIYEHARVSTFASIVKNWQGEDQAQRLGELMYESHDSYSACGLGSDGTDALIALAGECRDDGVFGAKITGGGGGGTVAVLARRGSAEVVRRIADRYRERTGYCPEIISGSSPGAGVFGHRTLSATNWSNP